MRAAPLIAVAALALSTGGCSSSSADPAAPAAAAASQSAGNTVLVGSAKRLTGGTDQLKRWRGRVVLVVNTASQCGYTSQLGDLQRLYDSRRSKGLVVLGFPSDDFNQEPLDGKAQEDFCERNFGVQFPMYARTAVTGSRAAPLFKRLAGLGAPGWNFTKYLLDRRGRPVQRFETAVKPTDAEVKRAIDRLL